MRPLVRNRERLTVRQVYVPLSVLLSSLFRFKKRTEVRKVYEIMSLSHIYVVYIALLLLM